MRKKVTVVVVLSLIAAGMAFHELTPSAKAQTPARYKTIWYGVYTQEQADRGKALYINNCSRCHGEDLSGKFGNPLAGPDFMDKWREDNVDSLFQFMKASMPPAKNRTTPREPLPDQTYLDIIGYVFSSNAFPTGTSEINAGNAAAIRIELKDGPKPLPGGALARVVGCLDQRGTNWVLRHATDPVRTRSSELATTEEITESQTVPLGRFDFTLANLGYAETFNPDEHKGHKMLIKGTLVRQPGAERINLTSATMLNETCQ